jgi:hypothetical protein
MATDTGGAVRRGLPSPTGEGGVDTEAGGRDPTAWDTDGIRSIYSASLVTGTHTDL